jgi:NTE family protein
LNPVNLPVLFRDFFSVRANFLAEHYQPLFDGKTLRHITPPEPGKTPRFIFCATTMQTGACWHFHGGPAGRMGDFYMGYLDVCDVTVGEAVAASSAFPPGFGALQLPIKDPSKFSRIDPWGMTRPVSKKRKDLSTREKRLMFLTDGGVYDNLGVEPIWDRYQRILISDAGHPFSSTDRCRQAAVSRLSRAAGIAMEQVGAVRKRWLVKRFTSKQTEGAMWTINTPLEDYNLPSAIGYTGECREFLSSVRTDFNSFSEGEQNCLENHGYSLADAALRSLVPSWCGAVCSAPRMPHPACETGEAAMSALRSSGTRGVARDLIRFAVSSISG